METLSRRKGFLSQSFHVSSNQPKLQAATPKMDMPEQLKKFQNLRDIQRQKESHVRRTLKQMTQVAGLDGVSNGQFTPDQPLLSPSHDRPNTMASFLGGGSLKNRT